MDIKTAFTRLNERMDEVESVNPSWLKTATIIGLLFVLAGDLFMLATDVFSFGLAAVATIIAGTLLFELWRTLVWKRRKAQP